MKTYVNLAGHFPHPVLVKFPSGFYSLSSVRFVVHAPGASGFWFRTGLYADFVGIVGAVIASIPGSIDLALHVPHGSPARSTGVKHMLFHVAAMLLFASILVVSWWRKDQTDADTGSTLVLATLGLFCTAIGWELGWRMVTIDRVGADGA